MKRELGFYRGLLGLKCRDGGRTASVMLRFCEVPYTISMQEILDRHIGNYSRFYTAYQAVGHHL